MENIHLRSTIIASVIAFGVLFVICLVLSTGFRPFVLVGLQQAFVFCHQAFGALLTAVGVGLCLSNFSGKLPSLPLGRALLLLLIGLAIFSMSPLFSIAAAVVYVADRFSEIYPVRN